MASITLKQGDTTPEFTATLSEPAQELTGNETIRFYMEAPADQGQQQGDLIVNAEIPDSQVDYQTNEVTYDFDAGETSRLGDHLAEFVVTYPDGEVQSFPESGYHRITIEDPTNRDVPVADLDPQDITVGVVDADQVSAPTLQAVETLTGSITGGQTLSTLAGRNLSIDADGTLNAESVADSASHTNPTYDSNEDGTVDAPVDSPSVTSETYTQGSNPAESITETTAPGGFTFAAGPDRDLHTSTDVTLANSSSSSATEDVTVELYDGTDTTGTLVASETQSVTVAAGGSPTATLLASVAKLDDGDYYLSVGLSGSTLALDETIEHTLGAAYVTEQTATGDRRTTDAQGNVVRETDAATGEEYIPNLRSDSSSIGELSVSDGDTVTSGPVGSSGDLVQMAAYPFDGKGYTASSTTFTKVATAVTEHRVIDYESIQNLPNIADVHYAWAGRVNANSGVDVTIRVSGSANTEATFTGSTFSAEVGPTAPVSAADSPRIPKLEVKTSDGSQGGVYGPSIILYGEKA